jgi:hypothetical protein
VYVREFNWEMYLEIIEFGDSPICLVHIEV